MNGWELSPLKLIKKWCLLFTNDIGMAVQLDDFFLVGKCQKNYVDSQTFEVVI